MPCKKLFGVILSLFVLVFWIAESEAKTITFKYNDHDPPGGMRTEFIKNVFLKEVVNQTGGKLKIQDFFNIRLVLLGYLKF